MREDVARSLESETLLRSYQQPDAETVKRVVLVFGAKKKPDNGTRCRANSSLSRDGGI